jgi:4-carboxymuconolactone decarboxylase
MNNTTPANISTSVKASAALLSTVLAAFLTLAPEAPAGAAQPEKAPMQTNIATSQLSAKQQAIGPIAAFAATGDLARLASALDSGLDAGLSVGDCKEILVQMYAYAGFPRSLNALGVLMKTVDARKQRGINDPEGDGPGPIPVGDELLAAGTANQTKLTGATVKGPIFDFAPAIDQYLKTHLFGDIFARTNLDWQSRELATVAALAAMNGVEPQLLSHVRVSLHQGLTHRQLRQFADVLAERVGHEAAMRARTALDQQSPANQ